MESSITQKPDTSSEIFAPSHLFLLRVWLDAGERDGGEVWRGKIQDTTTGESHSISNCADLIAAMVHMMLRDPVAPSTEVS